MDHAFENMPTVSPDLGNSLWKGVGQGIDNFINGLIEEAGNLVGAAVTKGPGARPTYGSDRRCHRRRKQRCFRGSRFQSRFFSLCKHGRCGIA
jgi:hypothetical protein